jgi:hypothetical protein
MVSNPTPSDIQNHWSRPFIEALAHRSIVTGLNGIFRPDNSLTRAEYAVIVTKAFTKVQKKRQYTPFRPDFSTVFPMVVFTPII